MKKSAISAAVALSMGISIAHAADMSSATFIMYDVNGNLVSNTCGGSGNCPNGVDPTLTGTIGNGVWSVASQETFFGQNWVAKSGTTFGPGTYTFDTMKGDTPGPLYTGIIVGPNQVGGHILFDWGAPVTSSGCGLAECNIDVVNVWDLNTTGSVTSYTSTDVSANASNTAMTSSTVIGPDGTPGLIIIDSGAFVGFSPNFEFKTGQAAGAPIAGDFTVFSDATSAVNGIDMLANADAGGPPGETLSLDACGTPSTEGGTIATNLDDTCDYTPPGGGLTANDTFTYTVFDGVLISLPGTVTVDFQNEAPLCNDITLTTGVNAPLDIPDADILDECTDPDGAEPLSIDSFTQPSNGTVKQTNSFTYTPDTNFVGNDPFTVTVSDTRNGIAKPTVTVQVLDVPFGNFTMLDPDGITFGGTNDVASEWDGTLNNSVDSTNFNMTIASASEFPFFGFPWFAHNIRVFGPGSYSFDTTCSVAQLESGVADCGGSPEQQLDLDIPAGMIGAHVLFDWNITENIDVALLWEADGEWGNPAPGGLYIGAAGPTPITDCLYEYVSRDADGDGTPGARMIDGPFIGFRANFNINLVLNRCLGGTIDVPKSSIKSADAGSGCTIGKTGPYSRGDLWLLSGVLVWLGVRRNRPRKVPS